MSRRISSTKWSKIYEVTWSWPKGHVVSAITFWCHQLSGWNWNSWRNMRHTWRRWLRVIRWRERDLLRGVKLAIYHYRRQRCSDWWILSICNFRIEAITRVKQKRWIIVVNDLKIQEKENKNKFDSKGNLKNFTSEDYTHWWYNMHSISIKILRISIPSTSVTAITWNQSKL